MNLDQIPASPIYTIIVSSNGVASIDGQEVTEPGLTPDEARVEALAEVRIKAAYVGRPVRVIAKDTSGTEWPLVVDVDGTVTTLDHQHPTAPRPPAQEAPAPPPALRDELTVTVDRIEIPDPMPTAAPPAEPPLLTGEWAAPLPASFRLLWQQLVGHEKTGALVEAIITADHLETGLAQQYGPHHAHTVNVMSVRAWLTMRASQGAASGWAETTELLVQTAQRRLEAKAEPQDDTARMIRNAHAAWRQLTAEDPEYAREIAEQVMSLLADDQKRARDVIHWIEQGAAA